MMTSPLQSNVNLIRFYPTTQETSGTILALHSSDSGVNSARKVVVPFD